MKASLQTRLHVLAFLVSLLLLVGHGFLPLKKLDLLSINSEIAVYSDGFRNGGNSQANWLDISKRQFVCTIKNGIEHRYCGIAIKYRDANNQYAALDLRGYDSLYLHLDYDGPQERLILFYRNTDFSVELHKREPSAFESDQYIFTYLDKNELNKPITMELENFDIADWWLQQYYTNRKQIHHGLEKVIEFGINTNGLPTNGEYNFTLHALEARGHWITKETLYYYIVLMWLIVAFFEGLYWAIKLAKDRHRYQQNLEILTKDFKNLEDSALKDYLTGTYNRAGLLQLLEQIKNKESTERFYLLVLDIDNFKVINDTYGHDVGDKILCQMVNVIKESIRDNDILCRWGGEEFVLISSQKSSDYALGFANKLREIVASNNFELTLPNQSPVPEGLQVTISVGVSYLGEKIDFDVAFKSADQCLYEAKRRGRNRAVLDKITIRQ